MQKIDQAVKADNIVNAIEVEKAPEPEPVPEPVSAERFYEVVFRRTFLRGRVGRHPRRHLPEVLR